MTERTPRTAAATEARRRQARRRRLDQAVALLRDAGYRITPPRTTERKATR